MIHALHQTVAPALAAGFLARLTLLLNHVLAAEPEATQRLRDHTGRVVRVAWQQWPSWLPQPPVAAWQVTPAGLLELMESELDSATGNGLDVTLDARALFDWLLSAQRGPAPMSVQGDAAFATTLGWLSQNLRWDIEDDLARLIGDVPARTLGRIGQGFVAALRALLGRLRPGVAAG